MDDVDVDPVDLGDELRQRVELGLGLAPVIVRFPVVNERLQSFQLDALRLIGDRLLVGPARRRDASTKVDKVLFRNVDVEGADLDAGLDGATHDDPRSWCAGSTGLLSGLRPSPDPTRACRAVDNPGTPMNTSHPAPINAVSGTLRGAPR